MTTTIKERRKRETTAGPPANSAPSKHRYVLPPPARYRPPSKWTAAIALILAIALHAGAVITIEMQREEPPLALGAADESVVEATIESVPPEPAPTPVPEDEPLTPEAQPTAAETPELAEEKPTVKPNRPVRNRPLAPIARPRVAGPVAGPSSISSAKALAISAPRPQYPYEARRARITGSGVILVRVDASSGAVTSVSVSQSTGSSLLDNAATDAFRRWRFKPGTVTSVRIPVTFTLAGAHY
jgi:periplasmic protein TonB